MAMPTALTPPIVVLRRDLRLARNAYRQIARQRVSDQADIREQHAYWRLHDTAKEAYARLDWRYQKTLLRLCMVMVALATALTALYVELAPLLGTATLLLSWRVIVVLTRMAPGED